MNKILIILSLVFLISCSQEPEDVNFITVTNKEYGMEEYKFYIRDLVEMNAKNLPITMDSNTKWVGFSRGSELKSVIYSFLLNSRDIQTLSETEIENMDAIQKRQVENDYCTNPQYAIVRTYGISSEYRYSDKDFNYLFSIFSKDFNCDN